MRQIEFKALDTIVITFPKILSELEKLNKNLEEITKFLERLTWR